MSACKIDMESRRVFLRRHTMKLLVAPIAIHAKRNDEDTNASQAKRPIASQLAPFPQHSEKKFPANFLNLVSKNLSIVGGSFIDNIFVPNRMLECTLLGMSSAQ